MEITEFIDESLPSLREAKTRIARPILALDVLNTNIIIINGLIFIE